MPGLASPGGPDVSGAGSEFDDRAATWDDPAKIERARRVAALILDAAPPDPGATLLEYGCGTGLLGLALEPRFAGLTLADASEGMLAVLRGKLAARGLEGKVRALRLDLEREPPPPTTFDRLATLLTLHHVHDIHRVLRAFAALVRPGGKLAVSDLVREDGSFHGPGRAAHDGFDRDELADGLRAAGFDEVRLSDAGEIERRGADGRVRAYPLFLAMACRTG